MPPAHRVRRISWLLSAATALAVAAVAVWTPWADAARTSPSQSAVRGWELPEIPDEIKVPDGNEPFLVTRGKGVQIYQCQSTASGVAWTFIAPSAILLDRRGKRVGDHGFGPYWRALDGSLVQGHMAVAVPAPNDPEHAIPWLRITARTATPARDGGQGTFTPTTFIHRLATVGGVAPAADTCTTAAVGTVAPVDYEAIYVFYRATEP